MQQRLEQDLDHLDVEVLPKPVKAEAPADLRLFPVMICKCEGDFGNIGRDDDILEIAVFGQSIRTLVQNLADLVLALAFERTVEASGRKVLGVDQVPA